MPTYYDEKKLTTETFFLRLNERIRQYSMPSQSIILLLFIMTVLLFLLLRPMNLNFVFNKCLDFI